MRIEHPTLLIIALFATTATAFPQLTAPSTPTAPLAFDAISIRPAKSAATTTVNNGVEVTMQRVTMRNTPDGFSAKNTYLKLLIGAAYNVKNDTIIGGPDWINSSHYDVDAKVTPSTDAAPPKLTSAQRRQMLQALLADRFKLVVHEETKDAPIFELTLAKGGSKLNEAKPGDTTPGPTFPDGSPAGRGNLLGFPGHVSGRAVGITDLTDFLSREVNRPVIDKTGLTAKYDIDLQFTPEQVSATNTSTDTDTSAPTLTTALEEQLGLKLTPTRGPVKTLVIDHIEPPSAN